MNKIKLYGKIYSTLVSLPSMVASFMLLPKGETPAIHTVDTDINLKS